jgi:cysteine desulfurase
MAYSKPIYLDYNATTPHANEVVEAMKPFVEEHFGNPSSSYRYGSTAKKAIEKARNQVAGLLGCHAEEVVFTSGGTESNNYAIKGTAFARQEEGKHIITSQIEHPAVIEVCKYLEKNDFVITYLPVDEFGMIRIEDLEKAIRPETILISIMHANNEVGTIQPVEKIAPIARKNGIVLHTDAAQSIGKIAANVNTLGVDLLSVAGHKVYAPKGIGALYIRNGVILEKIIHGAGQENGLRPGTENVIEIVGLGKACEIANRDLEKNKDHMREMRDRLYEGLKKRWVNMKLNGHPEKRLPNTLNVSFQGVEANWLLAEIGEHVMASAGAACHSDEITVSDVLKAMAVPLNWAKGTIRFSTGRMTNTEDIERSIEIIIDVLDRIGSPA